MAFFAQTTDSEVSIINPRHRFCPIIVEFLALLVEEIHIGEQFFIKLHNIYALTSQISFFILCQQHFDDTTTTTITTTTNSHNNHHHYQSKQTLVVALTTILFYSVFGYFANRVREIYQGRGTHHPNHHRSSNNATNYLKCLCRIILEWAKAVIVVLCLREQGIKYEPKLIYSLVTFTYYLCTERIFIEIIPQIIETFNISQLDNLEHLYVPLCMNISTICAGFALGIYSLYNNNNDVVDSNNIEKYNRHLILLALYFMVYLRAKDTYHNYWVLLMAEKEIFSSFQVATGTDIQEWDDICAVCLNTMSKARITPCHHLFHPYCLKQCLRNSFFCPLCKQNFLER